MNFVPAKVIYKLRLTIDYKGKYIENNELFIEFKVV